MIPCSQINLPVANTTEAGWSEIVGLEDQVLAVSAMFGMFQVNGGQVGLASTQHVACIVQRSDGIQYYFLYLPRNRTSKMQQNGL